MSDTKYIILKRQKGHEEKTGEVLWLQAVEVTPSQTFNTAETVLADWLAEHGRDHDAGEYLVFEDGSYSVQRFTVAAKTAFDIDQIEDAAREAVA